MDQHTAWTIGHSNRELAAFVELLRDQSIDAVADVRRFPGSRRHPQFGRDALPTSLLKEGIGYHHFAELGGRRNKRAADSPNTAWRVEAFNAFADYMSTGEFAAAFEALMELAMQKRTAIMCAEALPWRCHRRIIADCLVARGWRVLDIVGPKQVKEHSLPEFARLANGQLTYPGEALF